MLQSVVCSLVSCSQSFFCLCMCPLVVCSVLPILPCLVGSFVRCLVHVSSCVHICLSGSAHTHTQVAGIHCSSKTYLYHSCGAVASVCGASVCCQCVWCQQTPPTLNPPHPPDLWSPQTILVCCIIACCPTSCEHHIFRLAALDCRSSFPISFPIIIVIILLYYLILPDLQCTILCCLGCRAWILRPGATCGMW